MSDLKLSFNSDVVIPAIKCMVGDQPKDAAERDRNALCRDLLLMQPTVRMTTIAWAEVLWSCRETEWRKAREIIEPMIYDDTLTLEAADLAAQLARAERALPKFCSSCWGTDKDRPCTKCGRIVCREDRRNDLLIVASCVCAGVDVLYSFDGGHHHFAGHKLVRGMRIESPKPKAQVVMSAVDLGPESRVALPAAAKRSKKK